MPYTSFSGVHFIFKGAQICCIKGMRRYVLMPFLLTAFVFLALFSMLLTKLTDFINWSASFLPTYLDWLSWLLIPVIILLFYVSIMFLFSLILSFIAAPFYSLLAEKAQAHLLGNPLPEKPFSFTKDVVQPFSRQLLKFKYMVPRLGFIYCLCLIPIFGQTVAPLLSVITSAWMLALEYGDVPFEIHNTKFPDALHQIKKHKLTYLSFGFCLLFCTMIPVINLLIMPAAICGAACIWHENHAHIQVNKEVKS